MRKFFYLMAMAIVVLGFTACTDDNNDNPTTPATAAEQPVEQTEDAVTVKVDGSYVVYGELEHGFDCALQRRLQGEMASPVEADCFVFDVAALFESSLSVNEWKEVVRRCSAGDASFLITHCTFCKEDATLYVPKGCKEAYANANEWKDFKNIVEE